MLDVIAQAPLTCILLAANIAFSLWAFKNDRLREKYLFHVSPVRLNGEWHRFFTSGFLHGGPFHLLLNMYVLWSFGMPLEPYMSSEKFGIIYFASLLGGGLWSYMENRNKLEYRSLGASGALSGLLLSFAFLAPGQQVLLFAAIPMPAWFFAIIFIVASYFLSFRKDKIIGHEAHLGGALVGMVMTILLFEGSGMRFLQAMLSQISI